MAKIRDGILPANFSIPILSLTGGTANVTIVVITLVSEVKQVFTSFISILVLLDYTTFLF